jgi:hypothetical protein
LATIIFVAPRANAATIYTGSAYESVRAGESFVIDWMIDTAGEELNAVDLRIAYSDTTLKPVELSDGNSVISVWLKPPALQTNGTIELTGGVPNGFMSKNAHIVRTTFLAVKEGTAKIQILADSKLYRNDGTGSEALIKFSPLTFEVAAASAETISSPTHPYQTKWYADKDVKISFSPKDGFDYSYSFSSNLEIFPDGEADEWQGEELFENLIDGIYYFKLAYKVGPSAWQDAGSFRVQIDSTPPEAFTPAIGRDPQIFNGADFVSFSTVDKVSGISHYKVKVGLGTYKETKSPYQIRKALIGNHLTVRAYDNAGNFYEAKIVYPGFVSPLIFSIILALLLGSLIAGKKYLKQNR